MAIDKRIIVETITRMNELPARTYLPPDGTLRDFTFMPGPIHPGRSKNYTAEEVRKILSSPDGLAGAGPGLPFDVQAARQKLAEAGYADGKGFPSLPILFNSDNPQRRKIVQRLSNEWRTNLNIDIRIEEVEGKIFQKQTKAHEFAIATTAWYGDYPDASTFTDKYLTSSLNNEAAWEVPEYDELCAQAAKEPDAAKRMQLLERAENMIDTQIPVIPLYHYTNVALINPRVHGLDTNPRNLIVYKAISVEH
jgi:oligopeptide transport system substrate-binding protein